MLTQAGKFEGVRADQIDPERHRPVGGLAEPLVVHLNDQAWHGWRCEEPADSAWPPPWVLNRHQFAVLQGPALEVDGLALYASREDALADARLAGVLVPAW